MSKLNTRVIVGTGAPEGMLLEDLNEAGFRARPPSKRDYASAGPDASGDYVWVAVPDLAERARLKQWLDDAAGVAWETIESLRGDPYNEKAVAWVGHPCNGTKV